MCPRSVEVAALDVLHRSGWGPVTRDVVTAWFEDRSLHGVACPCWRCRAARKSNPGAGVGVSAGLAANELRARSWACVVLSTTHDSTALSSGGIRPSSGWPSPGRVPAGRPESGPPAPWAVVVLSTTTGAGRRKSYECSRSDRLQHLQPLPIPADNLIRSRRIHIGTCLPQRDPGTPLIRRTDQQLGQPALHDRPRRRGQRTLTGQQPVHVPHFQCGPAPSPPPEKNCDSTDTLQCFPHVGDQLVAFEAELGLCCGLPGGHRLGLAVGLRLGAPSALRSGFRHWGP